MVSVAAVDSSGTLATFSQRNSEVVHAGIYYPEGSWKARMCVRGRELLYERCRREGIPHRRLGKWIVACDERASIGCARVMRGMSSIA